MPIHDIQTINQSLSRLGIIRLGTSTPISKNGKTYKKPAEADHFVLTDAPDLEAAYGSQPQSLLIYLPFAGADDNFVAYHELWWAGYCKCRGDGQRIIDMLDPAGIERVVRDGLVTKAHSADGLRVEVGDTIPCPGLEHNLYERCKKCKPSGLLMVMVRDPQDETQLVGNRLGYYQIRTSSFHNIQNLTGQLRFAEQRARLMGRTLQGIPMILKRMAREIGYVDTDRETGEKVRRTASKYFLDLEFDLAWVRRANETLRALAMGEVGPMPRLMDGGDDDVVEAA